MSTELATEFRDAIADILSAADHEQCRVAGPRDEANCIAEGLFHRGFAAERPDQDLLAVVEALERLACDFPDCGDDDHDNARAVLRRLRGG